MFGSKQIAIDLGTANAVVYVGGKGIILQEPTVVAVDEQKRKVMAVGTAAQEMLGKAPPGIRAVRPLQNGTIAHYRATEALLSRFIQQAAGGMFSRPQVTIAVPAGLTSVEERAITRALASVGAVSTHLVPEPLAAAIGAGLPVSTPAGNMIVNIGAGTAEIAVISMRKIVASASHRGAGDAISSAIQRHLRQSKQLVIGEQMAHQVKHTIAYAIDPAPTAIIEVRGVDARTGKPLTQEITALDILVPVQEVMAQLITSVAKVLEQTPPELAGDIIERGVAMSGGTAQLHHIDRLFTKAIGVPFHVVEDPLLAVTRGLATFLT